MKTQFDWQRHFTMAMTLTRRLKRYTTALTLTCALPLLLSGCATALDAVIKNRVEANATPESMGISTAEYRGMSCGELSATADSLRKAQPGQTDALIIKSFGWRIDAINQVRRDKACDGGQPQNSSTVAMYGFCWQLPNEHGGTQYLSTIFPFDAWFNGHGRAEAQEFDGVLRTRYGLTNPSSMCQAEDSRVKAEALRKKNRDMFWLQRVTVIDVTWTPSPRASAAPARPAAVAAPAQAQVMSSTFMTITEDDAKKLGLNQAIGVLVSNIAPDSPEAKAGLRSLDVIQEVAGQVVTDSARLQVIVGRMRDGYQAPVRVWRQRATKTLTVNKAILQASQDGSASARSGTVTNAAPAAGAGGNGNPPAPPNKAIPSPTLPPRFCYGITSSPGSMTATEIYEMNDAKGDMATVVKADFAEFVTFSQSNYGVVAVPPEKVNCSANACSVILEASPSSPVGQFVMFSCFATTREQAEQSRKPYLRQPLVNWKPARYR